ncbi:MAG: tetratricopeptide repeat protein [Polyangiaceae bacterium]|nr:tetratricopeptide repeat protein [Polyangiaceae bacterium]
MSDPSDRRYSRPSLRPAPILITSGDPDGASDDGLAPDSTPSTRVVGEEFLFHLYRGSELLQDNCIAEAKEELERALAVQPRDVEGQGLLGVVYFRLGLYPRAIEIFEELLLSFPNEVAPRLNLALAYLKTGQQHRARELLEAVVERAPEHRRAWGYLGLVLERQGELAGAEAAFERAGQRTMAQRMRERAVSPGSAAGRLEDPLAGVRSVAAAAVAELDLGGSPFLPAEQEGTSSSAAQGGRWRAHEPGRDTTHQTPQPPPHRSSISPTGPFRPGSMAPLPSSGSTTGIELNSTTADVTSVRLTVPPTATEILPGSTPSELVRQHQLAEPPTGVARHGERTAVVRVRDSLTVRSSAVRVLIPDGSAFRASPAYRRARGRPLEEILGGAEASLGELIGSGRVVLGATSPTSRLFPVRLVEGELLYVRESFLVAFEGSVRHESGRLPRGDAGHHAVVQLAGEGSVVLEIDGSLHAAPISGDAAVAVVSDQVVGWTGRIFPRALEPSQAPGGGRGFVGFSGEGAVFMALV